MRDMPKQAETRRGGLLIWCEAVHEQQERLLNDCTALQKMHLLAVNAGLRQSSDDVTDLLSNIFTNPCPFVVDDELRILFTQICLLPVDPRDAYFLGEEEEQTFNEERVYSMEEVPMCFPVDVIEERVQRVLLTAAD